MEIVLERKYLNKDSTEGNLYVNGKWFCHTIEDMVRAKPGEWDPFVKVMGKTAIPYGRYLVLVTWSNRFQRLLTGVFGVPGFEGIRIHNGSSEKSSAGCIIVSYHSDDAQGQNRLVNDVKAMNDLCRLVTAAQKKGKIYIEIVEGFKHK